MSGDEQILYNNFYQFLSKVNGKHCYYTSTHTFNISVISPEKMAQLTSFLSHSTNPHNSSNFSCVIEPSNIDSSSYKYGDQLLVIK